MASAQGATAPAKKGPARFRGRIERIENPQPSLSLIRIRLDAPQAFSFVPGQFTYLYHTKNGAEDRRPYSIANAPNPDGGLEFAVKSIAPEGVSDWVGHRKPGDPVELSAALGSFHFASPPDRPAVFLATGTGVAPLRAMLQERWAKNDAREAWLFLGSSHKDGLPYHAEFEAADRERPSFHYVPTLSRADTYEWSGKRGWIQEPFLEAFQSRNDFDAYVCGVRRMVDDVVTLLKTRGVDPARIHFERYV